MEPLNINYLLKNFKLEDEWVVEKYMKDNKMKTIGKIIIPKTLHLNNQQLEWIFDLCNFGPAGYNLQPIDCDCIYNGQQAIIQQEMVYIPISNVNCCNDDIFIRKHCESGPNDNGYWIFNNHRVLKDEWVYSSRKEFQLYNKITI